MLDCSNFAITNSEMDCDHNFKLTNYLLSNQKLKVATEHPVRLPVVCFWIKKLGLEYFVFEQ